LPLKNIYQFARQLDADHRAPSTSTFNVVMFDALMAE